MKINDINGFINARNSLINLVNCIDEHAKAVYAKYGECKLVHACFIARQSTMKQINLIENILDEVYPQWRDGATSHVAEAHQRFNEECHRRTMEDFNEMSRRSCDDAIRMAQEHANAAMQESMQASIDACTFANNTFGGM